MRILQSVTGLCLLLAAPALCATSGWQSVGNVSAIKALPAGVELVAGMTRVRVVSVSSNVIRVRYAQGGTFPMAQSFAVLSDAFPQPPKVQLQQTASEVTFNTGAVQVKIFKSPLRVVFLDSAGKVISQDQPRYPASFNDAAFRVWKAMPVHEHYFGLGDHTGPLDHLNRAFPLSSWGAVAW